jgi:hypothetical protein
LTENAHFVVKIKNERISSRDDETRKFYERGQPKNISVL